MSSLHVERLRAAAYRIPTDRPESDGTLEWDTTTIVVVEIEAGDGYGLVTATPTRAPRASPARSWRR